jgi:hypothetical protein
VANKKKKKQNKNSFHLDDVLRYLNQGDPQKASTILKRVQISPEEAGRKKQIRVMTGQYLALKCIEEYNFRKAIEIIEQTLEVQQRDSHPLPIEISHLLMAMCGLYLSNFDNALENFEKVPDENNHVFLYYKNLTGIFRQNEKESGNIDNTFLKSIEVHETDNEKIMFARVINLIINEPETDIVEYLNKIEPQSHFRYANLKALNRFISDSEDPLTENSCIKPLYKLINDLPLANYEKNYLAEFEFLREQVEYTEKTESKQFRTQLIERLCIEGKPVDTGDLDMLIRDKALKDIHPYLVYNQAAALFNTHNESAENGIQQLIKKYQKLFFSVPESIYLFLQLERKYPEKNRPDFLFNCIKFYFDHHGEYLINSQKQAIGWQIIRALEINPGKALHTGPFIELANNYPEIVAFKLWMHVLKEIHHNVSIPDFARDIFSNPDYRSHHDYLMESIHFLILLSKPDDDLFNFFDDPLNYSDFKRILISFATEISTDILQYEPHRKATRALEIFKYLHKEMIFLLEVTEQPLDKSTLVPIKNAYSKLISIVSDKDVPEEIREDYTSFELLVEAPELVMRLE